MNSFPELRPSPIAGTWYTRDVEQLSRQIDDFIQQAELPPYEGVVMGLVAPHAGHRYSGRTAGYAYKSIVGNRYDTVVIVSPMHAYATKPLLTTGHQGYYTPLGVVPVDSEAIFELSCELSASFEFELLPVVDDIEHAVEIQLPFLQRAIGDSFKLLPVMVHSRSSDVARALGMSLAKTLSGKSVLLIASTDLSHFSPEPVANELDQEMLRQIAMFSPEGVLQAEHTGTGLACGAVPVSSVLWACQELGGDTVKVVHYSTSGEETGDFSSVVGYGAALILKNS